MKLITDRDIQSLGISASICVEWVKESFLQKHEALLPAKISLHPQGNDFFNTMPVIVPSIKCYGVKVVYRLENATPHLSATLCCSIAKPENYCAKWELIGLQQ